MPSKQEQHHVLVVEEGHPAQLHTFTDFAAFKQLLQEVAKALHAGRTQVFIFTGTRWHLSSGRLKYLLPPSGEPIPLFEPVQPGAKLEDGVLDEPEPLPVDPDYQALSIVPAKPTTGPKLAKGTEAPDGPFSDDP